MANPVDAAERELTAHPAIERRNDRLSVTTTPFDARIDVSAIDASVRYQLEIVMPSLDAVVLDQTVPEVVEDGWAETLELRMRDAHHATTAVDAATYDFERTDHAVEVTIVIESASGPTVPVDAFTALVGYAEGTYLEGVIPGYEYGSPVNEMLDRATSRLDRAVDESSS